MPTISKPPLPPYLLVERLQGIHVRLAAVVDLAPELDQHDAAAVGREVHLPALDVLGRESQRLADRGQASQHAAGLLGLRSVAGNPWPAC